MRKSNKLFIAIGTVLIILFLLGGSISKEANTRTPEYVLGTLTLPYESKAREFFYDNKCNLVQLSEIYDEVNVDSNFHYKLNQHNPNVSEIPEEICTALGEIAKQTREHYAVFVTQYEIIIFLGTGTYFDVYLHYGTPPFDSETSKKIELESGWSIYSEYVLRG